MVLDERSKKENNFILDAGKVKRRKLWCWRKAK
jgi:hypothetical protein